MTLEREREKGPWRERKALERQRERRKSVTLQFLIPALRTALAPALPFFVFLIQPLKRPAK